MRLKSKWEGSQEEGERRRVGKGEEIRGRQGNGGRRRMKEKGERREGGRGKGGGRGVASELRNGNY